MWLEHLSPSGWQPSYLYDKEYTYKKCQELIDSNYRISPADLPAALPVADKGTVYVIGSLRNPKVPVVANRLRAAGWDAFDDWFASGPEADDCWQAYEQARGHKLVDALAGWHANDVFEFDRKHLDRCDCAVLVLPAGKSAHMELGHVEGKGKPTYVLLDGEPDRFDVMYKFHKVFTDLDELVKGMQ